MKYVSPMKEDVLVYGWEALHFHAHATFEDKFCAKAPVTPDNIPARSPTF